MSKYEGECSADISFLAHSYLVLQNTSGRIRQKAWIDDLNSYHKIILMAAVFYLYLRFIVLFDLYIMELTK